MKSEERKIKPNKRFFSLLICSLFSVLFYLASCSFDYGPSGDAERGRPDIIMENIEYMRVREGDPQVRFQAELAERWEDRQIMELRNFSFEQLEDRGETVNAEGSAGTAVVWLESGDVDFSAGVTINIESEDIIIITEEIEWKDSEKTLTGSHDAQVEIERSDGTNFTGIGFSANARTRTWAFLGQVQGTFVENNDDDDDDEEVFEAAEETVDGDEDEDEAEWTGAEPRLPLPQLRIGN